MSEEQRLPTTERLATALREANAPESMIKRAEAGYYDDFKGPLAQNIAELVADCGLAQGLDDIAWRAMDGEFDATNWEADAWAKNTPEGRAVMQEFFGAGASQPRQGPAKSSTKFKQRKQR